MSQVFGGLQSVARSLLDAQRPVALMQSVLWRMLLQGWDAPNQQHDVCELSLFIQQKAQIPVSHGRWQARDVTHPFTVLEDSHTHAAIPLDIPALESTLQDCVTHWS